MLIDAVITDSKTVASWAVHHLSPERANREIPMKRRSVPPNSASVWNQYQTCVLWAEVAKCWSTAAA